MKFSSVLQIADPHPTFQRDGCGDPSMLDLPQPARTVEGAPGTGAV